MNHYPRNRLKYFTSVAELKRLARGRWREILVAAGIPAQVLDGRRGRPCPRCGGRDRFAPMKDLNDRGAVLCRHCHHASTAPKCGDGIASLRWWLGISMPDACRWLGEYLGGGVAVPRVREVVQSIYIPNAIDYERFEGLADTWFRAMKPNWRSKAADLLGLPVWPLERLRVGWSNSDRASTWPMRNGTGDIVGIRLRNPQTAKKWSVTGSIAGLFYDPALLSVERPELVWIVEGPTDTAALLSIGFDAVGVPSAGGGCDLLTDLARRILPKEIVIIADRDENGTGIHGAERIADALMIIAPVRIVTPPGVVKDSRAWVVSGASRKLIESAADGALVRRIVLEGSIYG